MHRISLSVEEWARLAAVLPQERERAAKKLARWIHWAIYSHGFNMENGPFSRAAIGGDAVEVITEECLEALFCGEWHWKPNRSLSSMLINIAKSKMGHRIEDYYEKGQPEYSLLSDYDEDREALELKVATQWKWEAEMRDKGYAFAREAVNGDPDLLAYLDAISKEETYLGVAIRMNKDLETVLDLEEKLLKLVANAMTK